MYNPMTTDEFYALSKNLDLSVFIEGVLGEKPDQVIVTDPKYFAAIDEIVSEETFESMKNWMLISCVSSFSDYLSEDFRLAASSYSMLMSGQAEPTPKEESAYYLAAGSFGEVVGDYYGRTYFGEEAKADVQAMVEAMVEVYKNRLEQNDWLGEEPAPRRSKSSIR